MRSTMHITVNGDSLETPEGTTISDLLKMIGAAERRVAVERNGDIVPRSEHPTHALANGDRLEIVHAIGGG